MRLTWLSELPILRRMAFAGAAGAIGALSLAPFDLWPLAVPAIAGILAATATAQTPRAAALTAWAGAAGWFALALHWIVEPFFVDAPRHGWMAPFALILMAGGLALFLALAAWISQRLSGRGAGRLAALAGLIGLAEYARAVILTGFPWAHPGHGLIGSEMLALAAWIGPHGLTLLVLLTAAAVAGLALSRGLLAGLLPLIPVLALGLLPLTPASPPVAPGAPVIRLIQPNAPQDQKWLPEMIPIFFGRGLDLTRAAADPNLGPPELVIWPETSLPVLLGRSEVPRAQMAQAAGNAALIVGAQRFEGIRPRNALAVLAPGGAIQAIYDKHHLVPFGEYLPLRDFMAGLGLRGLAETLPGGFTPGPGPVVLNLGARYGRAFPMICYEAIFPQYIRGLARPDWMLHVTNDAWFGEFSGPYQHLALARLRAVEQGLPLLRAANTGVSAVIDARGRVVAHLPLGQSGHLDARLPPPTPVAPIYARWGDWVALLLVALTIAGGFASSRRDRPLHVSN